jgi:hypothetical protein
VVVAMVLPIESVPLPLRPNPVKEKSPSTPSTSALNWRIFAWAGSEGAVLANFGEQTLEEAKLKFADLSGLSPSDATDRIFAIEEEQGAEEDKLVASGLSRRDARARVRQNGRGGFPNETDVVELAALWSIDPMMLDDQDHPLGLGLAARVPENLAQ